MLRKVHLLRFLFMSVLLGISVLVSYADTPVKRMSQLIAMLKEKPDDIETLIQTGQVYLDLCDYDGCRRMAQQLENIACRTPDSISALCYAKLLQGCANTLSGNGDAAFTQLHQALMIAENNAMYTEMAKANNALGFSYVNFDKDFGEGLRYYSSALESARASNSGRMVAVVLNNLADAYLWRHDFSGIRFAEEALNISRNADDSYGVLVSTLNLAHFTCYYSGQLDDVPGMLTKARDIQSKYGYLPDGEIDLVEGRYYIAKGDYHRAVALFDKALDGSSAVQPLLRVRLSLYKGWALMVDGKYSEAVTVLSDVVSLIDSTGYRFYTLQALSGVAYCYEQMGDSKNALAYLRQYQHRMDSLWITEQCIALTRYRLENEALLNETTLERQKTELNTSQKYIIILISIGVLLFAVICLMWYFYRRKEVLIRSIVAREKESMLRERLLRQSLEQARAESESAEKSPVTAMAEEKIEDIMVQFNELMSEHKAYMDSNISIKSVAEQLHTNRTYLSQAINRTFGKSFPQVLAEYRVRAAIEMMSNPMNDLPLKAIALEVGFSSPSVFFTTFRNIIGMTPAAYRNGQRL